MATQATTFGAGAASLAIDGDDTSQATSLNPMRDQWLKVDLGSPQVLGAWRVNTGFAAANMTLWRLLASQNGTDWALIDWRSAALAADSGVRSFRPYRARYWQYYIFGDGANTGYAITTFNLFEAREVVAGSRASRLLLPREAILGLPRGRPPYDISARGRDIAGDFTLGTFLESSHFSTFVASNPFLGYEAQFSWVASSNGAGHYVGRDFGRPMVANKYRVSYSQQSGGYTYKLQGSADGTNWYDVVDTTSTLDTGVVALPPAGRIPTRYWRLLFSAGSTNSAQVYAFSIYER